MAQVPPLSEMGVSETAAEVIRRLPAVDRQRFEASRIQGKTSSQWSDAYFEKRLSNDACFGQDAATIQTVIRTLMQMKLGVLSDDSPPPQPFPLPSQPPGPHPQPPVTQRASLPPTMPPPPVAGGGPGSDVGFEAFLPVQEILRNNWRKLTTTEEGNDPFPVDDEIPASFEALRILAGWQFRAEPPSFQHGSNWLGVLVHNRSRAEEPDWDFIIRICLFHCLLPVDVFVPHMDTIIRLAEQIDGNVAKRARLPAKLIFDTLIQNPDLPEAVRQIAFSSREFPQETFPEATGLMTSKEATIMLSSSSPAPGQQPLHLVQRFMRIFGREYVPTDAEVRLLPTSDNTEFDQDYETAAKERFAGAHDRLGWAWTIRKKMLEDSAPAASLPSAATLINFVRKIHAAVPSIDIPEVDLVDPGTVDQIEIFPPIRPLLLSGPPLQSGDQKPWQWKSFHKDMQVDGADLTEDRKMRVQRVAKASLDLVESPPGKTVAFEGNRRDANCIIIEPRNFQKVAIPHAIHGANMIVASETGSGKTMIFVMAMFLNAFPQAQRHADLPADETYAGIRAVVIVPTRNLAQQHASLIDRVARHLRASNDCFWERAILQSTDPKFKCGVVCSQWHAKSSDRSDRDHNFSRALIIVDIPNRLMQEGKKTGAAFDIHNHCATDFSQVKVIALDEVDKLYAPELKDHVTAVVKECTKQSKHDNPPQIICVSATVARGKDADNDQCLRWIQEDLFQEMRKGRVEVRGQPPLPAQTLRPALRLQSANFMPKSVFHLIVDLKVLDFGGSPYPDRDVRSQVKTPFVSCLKNWRRGQQGQAQTLWERLFSTDPLDTGTFPVGALSFCASNVSAQVQVETIQDAQKQDKIPLFGGSWASITNEQTAATRFSTLTMFRRKGVGALQACSVGSADMARGLDQHFNSVLISEDFPKHQGAGHQSECNSYVQSSGRCGRALPGVSVVFIRTQVVLLYYLYL